MTVRQCPENCGFSVDSDDPENFQKAFKHLADKHPDYLGPAAIKKAKEAGLMP